MRMSRVRVLNHSRLQDLDVAIRANLVLVGPNDVGKTSFLRVLDLALGASTAALYSRFSVDDFRDRSAALVVEVDFADFSPTEKALFPDEINVDENLTTSLTVRLEAGVDDGGTFQIRRTAPLGNTGRQLSREQVAGLGWKVVLSNQAGTRDFRNDRNDSLQSILSGVDLGDERQVFAGLLQKFEERLGDSEALGNLRERLAGQLSRAIPEPLQKNDLSFVGPGGESEELLADVRLQVQRDGREAKGMNEQSDGTKALYAMALHDFLSESANIVAIDEPEVHLHPTSQRSIAQLLLNGPNQKILATHSSDVVGAFPPEQVISVRPGGRLVQPAENFLSEDDKLVVHWWARDRLEPLTARRIVLLEGVADRIILQRVADIVGYDLDRLGVSVIELNGAGEVGSVQKLFGSAGFDIPLTFLIDADAVNETASKLSTTPDKLGDHSVFVCNSDLEAEYCRVIEPQTLLEAMDGSFNRNELANCKATGKGGGYTPTDLAAFCRTKKYKVRAALCAAKILDTTSASSMGPLMALLRSATP